MADKHLIVFIKNPILGKVKTRIAATAGDVDALDIYKKLLNILNNNILNININKHLFYSDFVNDQDIWDTSKFNKHVQVGNDLGTRMKNAFNIIFKSNENEERNVIIIGSDCPTIDEKIISEAFVGLEKNDIVIGPTYDGGYYLLGMKQMVSSLFENVTWSTSDVYTQTRQIAASQNLTCYELPFLNDIDTEKDWLGYLKAPEQNL